LTQETRGWLKDGFLAAFRRPVWLLNTARGPITPARAVLEGLANGRLRGAALDVLENESLDQLSPEEAEAFEALAAHEAVVLSPHIAGRTDAAAERIEAMLLAVLRDALGA
jgi:D-3-phosphoglycerate dehydrogenase